ncbi:MAG: hypothetical protein IKP38_01655 [Clostridia bacterium]|nr:hypothetical protein [Clostridia bacterium]
MQLSRKQMILIVTLSGVAVLLLIGLLIFLSYFNKKEPVPAEPSLPPATATPAPTDTPSPSPSPTLTPQPTPYFLPLVPEGAATTPSPVPATPFVSPSPAITGTPEAAGVPPRDGVYNDEIKEFMAIGTRNGEAIAVLLVRAEPPEATVVAIPCETQAAVYTLGQGATIERVDSAPIGTATARAESAREGCWNLIWAVKNLTGYRAPAYLCVDFSCMEAFFSFAPDLTADGEPVDLDVFSRMLNETDEQRAADMAQFGVGIVQYLESASLWELPAFRKATRGAFTSSLSIYELLRLMSDLKKVTGFTVAVLPTEIKNGVRVLSDAAVLPF